jgi:hypothetical protein
VNGEGGEAGPDLTLIGKQKRQGVSARVDDQAERAHRAGFRQRDVTLKSGETGTGSLASETPTQIVLKRADGTTVNIDPKQVKTRVTAPSRCPRSTRRC